MRMELPDQWTDITTAPMVLTNSSLSVNVPSVTAAYQNAYVAVTGSLSSTTNATTGASVTDFQGAECLYLIVTLGVTDNLGGRELFNESNIGDVDGDGFKEFQDGWGMPIRFSALAALGSFSDLQPARSIGESDRPELPLGPVRPVPPVPNNVADERNAMLQTLAIRPFLTHPLIYSAGSDKTYGLYTTIGGGTSTTTVANRCYPFMVSAASGPSGVGSTWPAGRGLHLNRYIAAAVDHCKLRLAGQHP